MKNKMLLFAFFCLMFGLKSNAQYWIYGGITPTGNPAYLESSNAGYTTYIGNAAADMTLVNTELGIGLTPNYKLDVLGDIDVAVNNNGYRIGTSAGGNPYVLWHNGNTSNIFVGVFAGNANTFNNCSFLGNYAGNNNATNDNTAMGYYALKSNSGGASYGTQNVAIGNYALTTMASTVVIANTASNNTAVGWSALKVFNPRHMEYSPNTAVGSSSLLNCDTGYDNTTEGYLSGAKVTEGYQNVAIGHTAMYENKKAGADVAVGFWALHNDVTGDNTATGYDALESDSNGSNNVANGYRALNDDVGGHTNTAVGNESMFNNTSGNLNVASGSASLYTNKTGDTNVAIGIASLYYNTVNCNTSVGGMAMNYFSTGKYNSAVGYKALFGDSLATGDSNAGEGPFSLYNITKGNGNGALGFRAGYSVTNDTDCLFLGALSNRSTTALRNAAAIGYKAITTKTNQMEVGNNNANVTMGLSGSAPSTYAGIGSTNLEIATENSPWPTGWGVNASTTNYYLGQGATGLRFHDLNSSSATVDPNSFSSTNYPQGVLSVDQYGNVIYIKDSSANGLLGYCSPGPLPALSGDAGTNLNNNNFYFEGNESGSTTQNSIIVGHNCGYAPQGKLDVLQYSKNTGGSVGIYVENRDSASTTCTPVIGIKAIADGGQRPFALSSNPLNIGGWFEVKTVGNICPSTGQGFALFVPKASGHISFGFNIANVCCVGNTAPTFMVNGAGYNIGTTFYASDSTLKTLVNPITNALATVQKLKGVSYYYIDSAVADSGMSGMHYGFIAQAVARVLPATVKTFPTPLSTGAQSVDGLSYNDIIPWTVEAIKQVALTNDSLRSTNDSLRYELDSLRSAFKYYSTCLASLCSDGGHAPVHHNGGGGNSDSNTTNDNVQNVTLSAATGVPLLYQNTPNPFTTGTKINYYLPVGTQGASILFFDTYGNQLKTVQLSQTGNGTLNITPDNLTSGIYSYSLIVNGTVIDTKRMLLQK